MSNPNLVALMSIEGELSIFTAADIRARMLQAFGEGAELEIDLAKVSEIDSAGVQVMIAAKREAAARNIPLRFIAHSAAVLDILDLCDLSGHFGDPVLIHSRT